jgi:hypothetical protein
MSSLVRKAYADLYNKPCTYDPKLKYSGRFKGYNGNIQLRGNHLTVSLSKEWKEVSPDIKRGIVQELLAKMFKTKLKTLEMDLYHNFLKSVHHTVKKDKAEPELVNSFVRVNHQFFTGLMVMPNLVFGTGLAKLGSYEYGTDTIMISEILLEDDELLDYVMYHEMLHKKHKFSEGRHHTPAFRKDERLFGDIDYLEKKLAVLIRKAKRAKRSSWWS